MGGEGCVGRGGDGMKRDIQEERFDESVGNEGMRNGDVAHSVEDMEA